MRNSVVDLFNCVFTCFSGIEVHADCSVKLRVRACHWGRVFMMCVCVFFINCVC